MTTGAEIFAPVFIGVNSGSYRGKKKNEGRREKDVRRCVLLYAGVYLMGRNEEKGVIWKI